MRKDFSQMFVIALFALVLIASGCADNTSNPEQDISNDSPEEPKDSPDEMESGQTNNAGPAELSVTSINVPGEIEMRTGFYFNVTVENTGGQMGEFEREITVKGQEASAYGSSGMTIEGEIPPGEEKTISREMTYTGTESLVWSLVGTDVKADMRVVALKGEIGDEYTNTENVSISVNSVELVDSYTYEGYGGEMSTNEPDSGQYVFVNVKAQNMAETPKSLPTSYDFQLIANNRQYEPKTLIYEPVNKGDAYEGGEVQPSIIRDGYMVFVVPDDVSREDVSVVWNEMISMLDRSVYWTT